VEEKTGTLETLEMKQLFGNIYKNKNVLVTGHTGFKGSWLTLWLNKLNANVYGIALPPPTQPNHFDLIDNKIESYLQDICNLSIIKKIMHKINPEIIFHLAAQPLVKYSYQEPVFTYMTNIMGTVNILEIAKTLKRIKAIIIITSDKCYENKEWIWSYRENESMGGADPYSSSKACAELITSAYRSSFFNSPNSAIIASARSGNVIGGGDWANDRIMTDIIRSANTGKPVKLRYPHATRPWQHVLEPLSGYLMLGWKLLKGKNEFSGGWNFGPTNENNVTVLELVLESKRNWEKIRYDFDKKENFHESNYLMLDSTKANKLLNWKPVWNFEKTVKNTMHWYKKYYENNTVISEEILNNYILDARYQKLIWCEK